MWLVCAVSETEVAGELEKGKCTLRQISKTAICCYWKHVLGVALCGHAVYVLIVYL